MSKVVHFPLYPGDLLADTDHLTTEQFGAYMRLLCYFYRVGNLPNCDKQLASIAKMTKRKWASNRGVLSEFFTITETSWTQKRAQIERAKILTKSKKAKDSGALGGKRRSKRLANAQANASETLKRNASQSESESDPTTKIKNISKSDLYILDDISKEELILNYGADCVDYYEQVLGAHLAAHGKSVTSFPNYVRQVILSDMRRERNFFEPNKSDEHPIDAAIKNILAKKELSL